MDKVFNELKKELPQIKKDVLLKDFTSYKIGGPAQYFFIAKNKEDLIKAVAAAKKFRLPLHVLGGGSNVLMADEGVRGLIVRVHSSGITIQGNKIIAESGTKLSILAKFCSERNLSGMEWAVGIPGTVSGAVFGNAQAFGERMADAVFFVQALNAKTLKILNLTKKQCKFSLKNSIFKSAGRRTALGGKNLIILSVVLKLKKGNRKEIEEKIKEHLSYRRHNHPKYPSAGSVFINPENKKGVIHAGFLIEQCGLKGKRIGGAEISSQHANFIVNRGGAKAKDVLKLIKFAKQKVKNKFSVNLEQEIQFIK